MKNTTSWKKIKMFFAVLLFVLFGMIGFVGFAIVSSCAAENIYGPPPDELVATFLDYLQAGEYLAADSLVSAESPVSLHDVEEEYRGIFHNLSYSDITATINGSQATVAVTITNLDFAMLMDNIMNEVFHLIFTEITSEELTEIINNRLIEKLSADSAETPETSATPATPTTPTIEKSVTVNLTVIENYWHIIVDEPFADAITGGLLSFVAYAQGFS
ncbi:MAG: hypothetical protein FWG68_11415 [Defluviitaleaceae bacterium]|nr:hypothetical protein [Defluviitaleaceae bacterium]